MLGFDSSMVLWFKVNTISGVSKDKNIGFDGYIGT